MAAITPVTTFPIETSRDVAVTTWAAMQAGDDGTAVRLAVYSDRSVQVSGVFGGATVSIGGSNDGETYHALNDAQGNAMSFNAGVLKAIIELPVYLKPWVTGGDGTTNLKVVLSGRKAY